MNLLLANKFTSFFVNLFSNWQLVLFVVLTILLILSIFFKRFKTAFLILFLTALGIGVTLLVLLIIDAVQWDIYGFIDFLVAWLPTIIFSLILILSTLINAGRGRRKSLIFLAQSASAAVLWVILYYFGAKSTLIDKSLVKTINLFMGENGLQKALNVSTEATTIRSIIALYLESLGGKGMMSILLSDTRAYVYTLADMVYHIAFAVVCYLLYVLTVFILYIIYLCCYSERKYKRKKEQALSENETDSRYKKHRTAGGIIGLVRGMVVGLMCMSFLGAGFYMVAGGKGEGKMHDYEMSGQYEAPFRIYRSIESYGTKGIFMILNAMSDPNDVPYYLFAADLVFSGELNDTHNGVSANVHLEKEFGALSGLARETIELLLKYGSDTIMGSLNGTSETGLMNSVLSVMKDRDFQKEFDLLIAQFKSPTYLYNFGMSLVSSVLANIDSMSFGASLGEKNKELVKIMFKEGYLSSYIPEDCELHDVNVLLDAEDPWLASGRNVRPYLGFQQLVTKEDLRVFLNIFLSALTEKSEGADTFGLVRSILPKVKELSLFDSKKVDTIDPVFGRVYCYLQNAYLKAEGAEGYSYNALVNENVKWTDEIGALLDVADDFFTVYDDVKDAETAVFNRLLYVFNAENPNRERDILLYDKIEERVSASRIMGKTLATSFVRKTLLDGLGQLFESLYIPTNTVYENTYDEQGKITQYGELHYFLRGLRHLGSMDNQGLFELMFSEEEKEISTVLSTIADAVKDQDAEGHNFSYYAAQSVLFRSVISCFFIDNGGDAIYVPKACYEKDEKGDFVSVIVADELERVLNSMSLFSDFVNDCVQSGDAYYDNIDIYLDRPDFMSLLETSRIVEGSLAKVVKEKFANTQNVIVPRYLEAEVESWCSGPSGVAGELRRFINSYLALRNQAELDKDPESGGSDYVLSLKVITGGASKELLLTTVSNLGANCEQFLASDVIHYTISNYLTSNRINQLTIVVPNSACTRLYDDVIDKVVKRDELTVLFSRINALGINDNDNLDSSGRGLLKKLIIGKDKIAGEVLSASIVANIAGSAAFITALKLEEIIVDANTGDTYRSVGDAAYLRSRTYSRNPWSDELPRLLNALSALFTNQVDDENFSLNVASMGLALLEIRNNPEAIAVCRESDIIYTAYEDAFKATEEEKPDPDEDDDPDNPDPDNPDDPDDPSGGEEENEDPDNPDDPAGGEENPDGEDPINPDDGDEELPEDEKTF